jgi:hypothetical protein
MVINNRLEKIFVIFLFIISSIFLFCHKEVMDLDLKDLALPIVIQGSITNFPGSHEVKISNAADYYSPGNYPQVSGATVTIEDDAGNLDLLTETEAGVYETTSIQGTPGRIYYLNIKSENKEYTASATMLHAIELDSLSFVKDSTNNRIYSLKCSFTDRQGVDDYCLFMVYKNGALLGNNIYIYSGEFTDGKHIDYENFDDVYFERFDTARIIVYTLDKTMYDCFSTLSKLAEQEQENEEEDEESVLFNLTYYNLPSNISNDAQGYFGTFALKVYAAVVQ